MAYYVGEEIRVASDGKEKKVFVFSCVPKNVREQYEQYKKQVAERTPELTKIAEEAIQANQKLTAESHQLLSTLYNEIANEKVQHPDFKGGTYWTNPFINAAEKVGKHIRILALDAILEQLKKAGYLYSPDDLKFLRGLVENNSGFWVTNKNSPFQFNIRLDMNNVYVTPFGTQNQHGQKTYPYSQISSLPQILSSFD
jgi:hypothetical protein